MLDRRELEDITQRIRYKPDWDFSVEEPDTIQGLFLFIHLWTPNAYKPDSDKVELRIFTPIPTFDDEYSYVYWVMQRVKAVELHELCEWFRYSDSLIIDPHRPL